MKVRPHRSMCRSVDPRILVSSDFRAGLDAAGRHYLVPPAALALRGIGHAQDLFTSIADIPSMKA